jgi:hypothetical protein
MEMVSCMSQRGEPSLSSKKEDLWMTTFADPAPQIKRDRYGRPLITPPDGEEPVPYVRATTWAGTLDDTHGLIDWKCRMTALGIADRTDLRIATAAHRDDKKELDSIVEQAQEASASSAAATMGTAVHKVTELIDTGKPTGRIPDEIAADVAAYQKATAAMKMLAVETFVVVDQYRVGGTFDRQIGFEGSAYIGDLKTGASLKYGVGKFAIQLALYSRGQAYNFTTGERTPLQVDQDWGIVIHLPVGKGECTVYWIDLAAGWEAVEYCRWVREWRGRKDLLNAVDLRRLENMMVVSETPPAVVVEPAASPVIERVEIIPTLEQSTSAPVAAPVAAEVEAAFTPALNPFTAPDRESLAEWIASAPTRDILVKLWDANHGGWDENLTALAAARGNLIDAGMVGAN